MAEAVFNKFYALLEKKTGISLDDSKQYLIESRLAEMLKASDHESMADFIGGLVNTLVGPVHWQAFDALTTNETMFFRDRVFFDALADHILPSILLKKKAQRTLRILCSAVSTGQEAYSVAMLLKQRFAHLTDWTIYIQATDISPRALDRARAGRYTKTEVMRGLDPGLIQRFFVPIDGNRYEILPEIRDAVNFMPANLLDAPPSYPKFDLILLRNVLIYFVQSTKDKIYAHAHTQLDGASGILALGSTESISSCPLFKLVPYGKVSCYAPA